MWRWLAHRRTLRLERAVHDQQTTLARELHDNVAQDLAFIIGQSRRLAGVLPGERGLADIEFAATSALDETRSTIDGLGRSGPRPLGGAVSKRRARLLAGRAGVDLDVDATDHIVVRADVEHGLLLILNEALSNATGHAHLSFLIVDGIVLKQTTLIGRSALELLAPGDLLGPLTAARQLESQTLSCYLAHGPVSLAAIEDHFRQAARRWPGIADVVHDRLARQTHHASRNLAMLHLPRIEDRLIALFADLTERLGRVSADSILIDLPVTHELIGGLVAGRRPTVTIALRELACTGLLQRDGDRWKLARKIVPLTSQVGPSPSLGSSAPSPADAAQDHTQNQ